MMSDEEALQSYVSIQDSKSAWNFLTSMDPKSACRLMSQYEKGYQIVSDLFKEQGELPFPKT
jgi:hypothetical protein